MNDMEQYSQSKHLYESDGAIVTTFSDLSPNTVWFEIISDGAKTSTKYRVRAIRETTGSILWESGKWVVRGVLDRWIEQFISAQREVDKILFN